MKDRKDAQPFAPELARALLTVPPRALRAFAALAAHADDSGQVSMSAKQLAEAMSTPTDAVSHDTALRCLHALDARYGGSGHIEHIGMRPTDAVYQIRPFGSETPNQYVREDRIRKVAYVRSVASVRSGANERMGASIPTQNCVDTPPPYPPYIPKPNTTTNQHGARRMIRGGGGGEEVGGRENQARQAAPQDAGHGIATPPDAGHGRTEAPAAVPDDLPARLAMLEAVGVGSSAKRREYAPRFTVEEIRAAGVLARKYAGGGGAVLHELDEGNATTHVQRIQAKAAAAPTPAPAPHASPRIEQARAVLATKAADDFNAAAHIARVKATAWPRLMDAMRAVLRRDQDTAARLMKRGMVSREIIDANDGSPGREALEAVCTHPLTRAAIAAELDQIDQGTTRVVPDPHTTEQTQ